MNSIDESKVEIRRTFEVMGHQFVLVTIHVEYAQLDKSYKIERPRHWRVGGGESPPFDISFLNRKLVQEISFFISDQKIPDDFGFTPIHSLNGIPIFEHDIWNENEFYLDRMGAVDITRMQKQMICRLSNDTVYSQIAIDEQLSCIFSPEKKLVGIILDNLKMNEVSILEEAGVF